MLEQLEHRLVPSTITDLGTLPTGVQSLASGVNASGQVVGDSTYQGNAIEHAFLYSNGQMTDMGTLGGANSQSYGYGINTAGQVVGWTNTSNGDQHAFLYSNGQMTDLGTLSGSTYSFAYGINDSGQIAGESNSHAFLYSNGQMTDLGTLPNDTQSSATAIDNSGQVVGSSGTSNGDSHAFLYSNGQMTDLGTLPSTTSSFASGINAAGQVIGDSVVNNDVRYAFLYSNGQMTNLGTLPGGSYSSARGINDSGQVVGVAHTSSGSDDAFLYSNGHMIDLNTLLPQNSGWVLKAASAINDSDQIVGTGTINGQTHAFLLSIGSAPTITANPSGQTVTAGATASFTASASGTPTPTVQWQVSTNGGATFTPISWATGPNLILTAGGASAANGDEYEAVFTNSAGSVTTAVATLTVLEPPTATTNPSNVNAIAGQNVTFTASANGDPAPTVQWQVSTNGGASFTPISGATSTTLTVSNVTPSMSGDEYEAVFTNSAGSITTGPATLAVTALPPTAPPPLPPAPPTLNMPPLLSMLQSLLGGTETENADGSATVTDSFFGIPLFVATFDPSGDLVTVSLFGFDVTFMFEQAAGPIDPSI